MTGSRFISPREALTTPMTARTSTKSAPIGQTTAQPMKGMIVPAMFTAKATMSRTSCWFAWNLAKGLSFASVTSGTKNRSGTM